MKRTIRFTLNGEPASVSTNGERILLWVLRTELGLTGKNTAAAKAFTAPAPFLSPTSPSGPVNSPSRTSMGTGS